MIRCPGGNSIFWTWCLLNGISNHLDTEIAPPYPKSWDKEVKNEMKSITSRVFEVNIVTPKKGILEKIKEVRSA